jgi:hypothetical protein
LSWGIAHSLYIQPEDAISGQGSKKKETAVLLLYGAEAMCNARGLVKIPPLYEEYREVVERAQQDLTKAIFEHLKTSGLQMSQEETISLASSVAA